MKKPQRYFRQQPKFDSFVQIASLTKLQLRVEQQWLLNRYWKYFTMESRFEHLFDFSKIAQLKNTFVAPRRVNVRTRKSLCVASKRPRGFNQFTGLSRFRLKEFVELGILPGIYRASW